MANKQGQPTPSTESHSAHPPRPASEKTQGGDGGPGNQTGEAVERLGVCVRDSAHNELHFTVRKSTRMAKVIEAWCARHGVSRAGKRFLIDGSVVHDEDTPESLEMEDGDIVEVYEEQVGGARGSVPGRSRAA